MDNKNEMYNTEKALIAQEKYCKERDIPNFAPRLNGKCYRCNRDIYKLIKHENGHETGITVEKAGNMLVTGCPHCHFSFVD